MEVEAIDDMESMLQETMAEVDDPTLRSLWKTPSRPTRKQIIMRGDFAGLANPWISWEDCLRSLKRGRSKFGRSHCEL